MAGGGCRAREVSGIGGSCGSQDSGASCIGNVVEVLGDFRSAIVAAFRFVMGGAADDGVKAGIAMADSRGGAGVVGGEASRE